MVEGLNRGGMEMKQSSVDEFVGKKFHVNDVFGVEDGKYEVFGSVYQSTKGAMYLCKREGSTTMIGLSQSFVERRAV